MTILASSSPQQSQRRKPSTLKQYYDHETQDTMTVLHIFCRSGAHYRDVRTIVDLQPRLISHPTLNGGDTPLHFAVAAHDLDTTRFLLRRLPTAANTKSRTSGKFGNQMTALHVAIVANATFEIVEALVQASPRSVKLRDGNGHTAYQLAVEHSRADNIRQILKILHV